MRSGPLDSAAEVDSTARNLLRESRAFGVFPTPVDLIVRAAELRVEEGVDLSNAKQSFFSRTFDGIGRVSRKVLGLLDFRSKTIYLDLQQGIERQRFIKLHEVGHEVLPWQAATYRWDDEKTLDPLVNAVFEREASHFASATLFQLERFDEVAGELPLSIKSPIALSRRFGASCQATIRRYAQCSTKRCAVLVMELPDDQMTSKIRNCFESPSFSKEFGFLEWPESCDASFPFVRDLLGGRRLHEEGRILLKTENQGKNEFAYHFFNNRFNGFVMLFPQGEFIRSRTRIVLAGPQG